MGAIAVTTLVCRRCSTVFFAEYGVAGGTFCSESCEHPPVADPDDDDGFDGLPFDPESGEHHCVFVRPGCDVSELPSEWRYEASYVLDQYVSLGFGFGRCVCGNSHTVLGRDDVRRLRAAGFVVEAVGNRDCSEFGCRDYDDCGYGYGCRDYDNRSPAAYLRGDFDAEDRNSRDWSVESYYDELDLWSISDELEVIRELGYAEPTGVRELLDGDAPVRQPEKPFVLAPEHYVVGVFEITRSSLFRWKLRHRFGGLAPCETGEYAKVAEYMGRFEATDAAKREMTRLGMPVAA